MRSASFPVRQASIVAATIVASLFVTGAAMAAGPTPGHGPWSYCPNASPVCANQLGPDLDPTTEYFECLTRNGKQGIALQNGKNARAQCWAS